MWLNLFYFRKGGREKGKERKSVKTSLFSPLPPIVLNKFFSFIVKTVELSTLLVFTSLLLIGSPAQCSLVFRSMSTALVEVTQNLHVSKSRQSFVFDWITVCTLWMTPFSNTFPWLQWYHTLPSLLPTPLLCIILGSFSSVLYTSGFQPFWPQGPELLWKYSVRWSEAELRLWC